MQHFCTSLPTEQNGIHYNLISSYCVCHVYLDELELDRLYFLLRGDLDLDLDLRLGGERLLGGLHKNIIRSCETDKMHCHHHLYTTLRTLTDT